MLAENLKKKLEPVIDFRIKRNAHKTYPLTFQSVDAPCTDMERIIIPRIYRFSEDSLVDTTRHEADHIKEMEKFSRVLLSKSGNHQVDPMVGKEYVEEFIAKSDFRENPALAFEIFNIVEDLRIDTAARKELSGAARIFEKEKPVLLKKRPSTILMNKLDKFRELFIQKALLEKTAKKPPKKLKPLLDKCVAYAKEAQGKDIPVSLEATAKIYRVFKEHFNIKRKMLRLPSLSGRGKKMQGFRIPQNPGYTDRSEPEQETDSAGKKRGDRKDDGKGKKAKKEKGQKGAGKGKKAKKEGSKRKRGTPFQNDWMSTDDKKILSPRLLGMDSDDTVEDMISKHAGEIEGMKKVLRRLKRESMTQRRARAGEEIEIEEYLQQELEKRATGVRPDDPIFLADQREKLDPGWAVLADISSSTPDILDEIKATLIILGETMKRSGFCFGLYAFHSEGGYSGDQRDVLHRLKDFEERYATLRVLSKIMALESQGGTKMADSIVYLAERLKEKPCRPKILTIVSDGEPNHIPPVKRALKEARNNGVTSFFCVIGREHESSIKRVVQKYILIERDELARLPNEILKIMRLYHIGRS